MIEVRVDGRGRIATGVEVIRGNRRQPISLVPCG